MINFKTEKGPKMKCFDFGKFQIKMPSHKKILFQILFGAFHITSRSYKPGNAAATLLNNCFTLYPVLALVSINFNSDLFVF